MNETSL